MTINMLAWGAASLAASLQAVASESVTISQGGHSVTLLAMVGRTERPAVDDDGNTVQSETVDFVFTAADLVLNGNQVEPNDEMQFERTIGPTTFAYEVRPPSLSEQCFRWCDPQRTLVRVHTKLILK